MVKDIDLFQKNGAHMYRHKVLHVILAGFEASLEAHLKPPDEDFFDESHLG